MTEKVLLTRVVHGKIRYEWEIENVSTLTNWECFESPTFSLSKVNWCIQMCLHVDEALSSTEWIALFLIRKSFSTNKHPVSFTIGVKKDGSVLRENSCETTFDEERRCAGFSKFLIKSELIPKQRSIFERYTDSVIVFCTAKLISRQDQRKDITLQTSTGRGHPHLSRDLKDLFLNERMWDVKIKIGDTEFKAHKSVLGARSTVFASMFEHDMKENNCGVVDIADSEPESFKNFLLYLYSGDLSFVSSKNIPDIYKNAEKYNLKELKEECCQRLNDEISVDLVCDIVHLSVVYNETALLKTATNFFIENAPKVISTPKWETFMAENSPMAKDLLIKMVERING